MSNVPPGQPGDEAAKPFGQAGSERGPETASSPTVSMAKPREGDAVTAAAGASGSAASLEKPGETIGPYTLVSVLGEGGFGTVWLAERREPMVQRVALKIIKPGMDSAAVVARFAQERQALAVMDHPNVARVFDGGVTDASRPGGGRPYFVMEYVKGEPITTYADRQRLTLRERLELFVTVCDAVQHAHAKGIIHRDLKPSNILAEQIDGSPVVKVIDFGIAKAVTDAAWAKSAFTLEGMVIGTPEYMSPEQVAGSADIDTRSDVYALGVVLYEMLTGVLPFESEDLRRAGFAEIQRIIREQTPPKPSTRLMQLAGERTTSIAHGRSATRERLSSELRRELDWIPLMALRKERERRYASAAAMADDIRRYVDGRPLVAAPDSRMYLARKFVKRNRVQVLAAAAVFVALAGGLAAALWQANEASFQRDEAVAAGQRESEQRKRADERAEAAERAEKAEKERADQLKQVSDFQSQMLAQIDTTTAGVELMLDVRERFSAALEKSGVPEEERAARLEAFGQELVRVNATDAAAAMIDRTILKPAIKAIDEQFKDQPLVDAQLRQALADLYASIGLLIAAEPLQIAALDTRRRLLGDEHQDTLASLNKLGHLRFDKGEYELARTHWSEVLSVRQRVLGMDHPSTIESIGNMGALLEAEGRVAEAEPLFREALAAQRRLKGDAHPDTVRAINNLGFLLESRGELEEAESLHREALEKARVAFGEDDPETLQFANNLAMVLQSRGNIAESEPLYRSVLDARRRVLGEEHPRTLESIGNMGYMLHAQGRLVDALPYIQEAVDKGNRVLGEEHPFSLAFKNNLATLLEDQGRLDEAVTLHREVLAVSQRVLGPEHPNTLSTMNNLAYALRAQGNHAEAETLYLVVLEARRRVLGEEHEATLRSMNNLALLYESAGDSDRAEAIYRELLEIRARVLGDEHPDTCSSLHNLGTTLATLGRPGEAETYLRQSLEMRRRVLGERHPDTISSLSALAAALRDQGESSEAEPLAREAMNLSVELRGDQHAQTIAAIIVLAKVLIDQERQQEAVGLLLPAEPAARKVFIGGNAPRLAGFLVTLGGARLGMGFDPDRFKLAEAGLLEAHEIFAQARGESHKDTLECVQGLIDLYTAWHTAEPEKGYDAKAAEWQAKR